VKTAFGGHGAANGPSRVCGGQAVAADTAPAFSVDGGRRRRRRSSMALIATISVLAPMISAPHSGCSTTTSVLISQ
jgi:hypothetical protein